jgi:predicted nucleic acid-binding protein
MKWVVDTCVIVDVLDGDPKFGANSAKLLERLLSDGLSVSPVTMLELAPAFDGNLTEQKRFLNQTGIDYSDPWNAADLETSHQAWHQYVVAKRIHRPAKRVVADLMIGGFAANRRGLITRNLADYQRWFPDLTIREP